MDTTSHWVHSSSLPTFPKPVQDYEVDVVVVGCGITGVTTAYLLKKAGKTVALLERGRAGGFDTDNTTAHVTAVIDVRLHELVNRFGPEKARLVWGAGTAAIEQIADNIRERNISCEFESVPGYLHVPIEGTGDEEVEKIQEDLRLAKELGIQAEWMDAIPGLNVRGIQFPNQAKFHPRKYLAGLLSAIPGDGSYIFEQTEVKDIQGSPMRVDVGEHQIRCQYAVLATHTPLTGCTNIVSATLLQTKLFLYTSYAVSARAPHGTFPGGLYWDTAVPYHYLRVDNHTDHDYLIFGGEDHKTGQLENTQDCYRKVEDYLRRMVPGINIDSRWSGQVIETPDGLPYMGETAPCQFIATGYGGNGITFGTLGAMLARDAIIKRTNPWADLFDIHRKALKESWEYIKENKDFPYFLVRDRLGSVEAKSTQEVAKGEGKIIKLNGRKVAAYRSPEGELCLMSPVCTHLKCIVAWNDAERTWDCPCHGSRFSATGEVLSGPAETSLEVYSSTKGEPALDSGPASPQGTV